MIELDRWLVDARPAALFESNTHKSDLESFYSDSILATAYPLLFKFFRSLLLLNPSAAFNERINSILGNIRTNKRKSLKFNTTRSIIMTKSNVDLIDYKLKKVLDEITEVWEKNKSNKATQVPQQS